MSARRHRPWGVIPLEVWDAIIDGAPLYLAPRTRRAAVIAELVVMLRQPQRVCPLVRHRAGLALPTLPIARVVVAGGNDVVSVATAIAARLPDVDVTVPADGVWLGVRGGRRLLAACGTDGLVVDVGQTAVKRWCRGTATRRPRDLDNVPLESDVRTAGAARTAARGRTVAWLRDVIRGGDTTAGLAVLGLPCEIDDDGTVAGCSYPWDDGDRRLIDELVGDLGCATLVVNDAELAALGVERTTQGIGTLVLTLGLGVGAAYLA